MDERDTAILLERFVVPERLERLESVLTERTSRLTVVLDRIRNYHNISAVLRSADAFGLCDVHLVDCTFEYSPSISQGTERWMRIHRHASTEEALAALTKDRFHIAALQAEELSNNTAEIPCIPVTELPFEQPLALVFGNEHSGVSEPFLKAAQMYAFIPMKGFVESLNISVACAITLFCSTIRATAERRTQPLSTADRETLRADWLKASVRRSEDILRAVEQRNQSAKSEKSDE